jgi:hypothetical protein
MSIGGLRVEDRLAGAGNWSPWKARIVLILEEGELWDIVENNVVPPTDAVLLAKFREEHQGQEDYSRCNQRPYNSSCVW